MFSLSRAIEQLTLMTLLSCTLYLPGSGKSHFSTQLESSFPEKFVRVNQDTLKTRVKCENACRNALARGKVAIIDRCNFDLAQRAVWLKIAKQADVQCECVVFQYDKDECITRCQQRKGHESLHPSKAVGVISLVAKQYRPPQRGRGECFQRIEYVSSFRMADNLAISYLQQ